jgi:hypothetical protein
VKHELWCQRNYSNTDRRIDPFGSSKIPEFARSLRKGIEEFKKTGEELSKGIETKNDEQAKK